MSHVSAASAFAASADIVVVTEGVRDLLPCEGAIVYAGGDWGYGPRPSRRKVVVWSRFPLSCDAIGEGGASLGRLAVATAHTPDGPIRIVGVCIPWRDAHVSTGRSDATPWSEHMEYLGQLENLLAGLDEDLPTVIAGDFNQRIPRGRQPVRVFERLNDVLGGWTVHTAGALPNGPHIDHIATNRRLLLESVRDWPASDQRGRLSDHAGVLCRFALAADSEDHGATSEHGRAGPTNESAPCAVAPAEEPAAPDEDPIASGTLTPRLRVEIEDILRRSGDGLSHGATFRLREQGLDGTEIAAEREVSVGAPRGFLRSLDALLVGTIPTNQSAALRNSYVYRELLNHPRSDALDSYVKAQLHKLKLINPDVSFDPLKTRSHQYRVGKRKQGKNRLKD